MPTFLQLCKQVRQECGVAGDGPTTVLNQTGVMKKIVDRTAQAWVDIQASRPYWKFMRNQFEFETVVDQREYPLAPSIADGGLNQQSVDKFDRKNTYLYLTSTADEKALTWMPYDHFRNRYRTYPPGRPTVITEQPGRVLAFNSTPDAIYTVTCDYWMTPEFLAEDDDVPGMPEHFHNCLVWRSVMMFAGNETASDLFSWAKSQYTPQRLALDLDQGDMPQNAMNYPIARGERNIAYRVFT
jgi:hypothetical protein